MLIKGVAVIFMFQAQLGTVMSIPSGHVKLWLSSCEFLLTAFIQAHPDLSLELSDSDSVLFWPAIQEQSVVIKRTIKSIEFDQNKAQIKRLPCFLSLSHILTLEIFAALLNNYCPSSHQLKQNSSQRGALVREADPG